MGIERLLAGLVPECPAPGVGAGGAAKEREHQQIRFRDAIVPPPRLGLVQPERRKGDEVDRDEGGGDVNGGEDLYKKRDLFPSRSMGRHNIN